MQYYMYTIIIIDLSTRDMYRISVCSFGLSILVIKSLSLFQGLGLFLGFACIEQRIAFLANYTAILVGILFSGFITATYPPWLAWAKYISVIRYPLSSMCIVLFQDMESIP